MITTYHLIIVTGCQRSGTTLLGQMLGAHPNTFLIDEPDGLYQWFDHFIENESFSDDQFRDLVMRANQKYRDKEAKFSHRSGALKGVTHLVLKAPNLAYYFDKIAALKTGKTMVFPVRDARAVASSMARLTKIDIISNQVNWLNKNLALAKQHKTDLDILQDPNCKPHVKRAIIWRIKTGIFTKYVQKGLQPVVFRYEDLVSAPETFCQRVCRQASLLYDQSMLHHENFYLGLGPGATRRTRSIDTNSLATWSNDLSPLEQKEILVAAKPLMKELGYDF